jgi:hypothetical protein
MVFSGDGNTFTINLEMSNDGSIWRPLCRLNPTKLE